MESSNNTLESIRRVLEYRTFFREFADVALSVVPVSIVIINTTILVAFIVQKLRSSRTKVSPSGLVVLNLLFADAFVGAVLWIHIALFLNKTLAKSCNIRMGFIYIAGMGTHFALINVVAERFVALVYTLQHRDWMTFHRSVVMVSCGWLIPIAGGIAAFATIDGHPGLVRCIDIKTYRTFAIYVLVPSNLTISFAILVIQCCLYVCLRRYEWDSAGVSSHITRRSSEKSARILYLIATPTCIALIFYDVMLVTTAFRVNHVTLNLYHLAMLLLLLSNAFNPVVYSFATANVRKPVTDLCSDIKKWWQRKVSSERCASNSRPPEGVCVIRTEGSAPTSQSTLSDFA